ncbi:MAG: HAMP domain-containing sensor histidine kinase [Peptoniphilaceae bacterium]|nr:HAMP domain-containing histidine kinase [Peptoniphilaceae bacterium]MDD7382982.1 HAMP domain-containing sensor histidine kinase [Peptoniphilaceae bacterium]MDY3737733.1 HAMP domain-containing sensor histidine kinase [Peptoniphilaceae bacterium]
MEKVRLFSVKILVIFSIITTLLGFLAMNKNVVQKSNNEMVDLWTFRNFFNSQLEYAFGYEEPSFNTKNNSFFNFDVKFDMIENYDELSDKEFFLPDEAFIRTYTNSSTKFSNTDEEKIYTIKGKYDGKITFTSEEGDKNDEYKPYIEGFKYILGNFFDTDYHYRKISKAEFTIKLNFSSKDFLTLEKDVEYFNVKMPNYSTVVVISCVLVFLFFIFRSEKKLKNDDFIIALTKTPFEIAVILTMTSILLNTNIRFKIFTYNMFMISIGLYFITLYYLIVSIYYAVIIKSIVSRTYGNLLFENSIIIRIISFIYKKIKARLNSIFDKTQSEFIKTSRKNLILTFSIFYIGFVFVSNTSFLANLIALLLLFIIYKYIMSIVKNLEYISNMSDEIASGNYSVKIATNKKYFDTIVKNFNQITENLDKAVEEKVKSERFKVELITNISHDLKTPLTSIINYSKILNHDELGNEEIKNYSKIIYEKSQRLKKLIEDLFEFSKLSSKNLEVNIQNIDLIQLLEQTLGEWEENFEKKNLEIIQDFTEKSMYLNLDGSLMFRVLDNIFSNVYKYAMKNTRVYINIKNEEKIYLEIKNISEEKISKDTDDLMERFIRGDVSRKKEGTGLGLSIAKTLTESQGGKFHIEIDGDLFKAIIEFPKEELKNEKM